MKFCEYEPSTLQFSHFQQVLDQYETTASGKHPSFLSRATETKKKKFHNFKTRILQNSDAGSCQNWDSPNILAKSYKTFLSWSDRPIL
jgi:hypothetical protein